MVAVAGLYRLMEAGTNVANNNNESLLYAITAA